MKTNGEKSVLTLGAFVSGAYRAWGARRAKGLVRLAIEAHLVVFRDQQPLVMWDKQHDSLSTQSSAG